MATLINENVRDWIDHTIEWDVPDVVALWEWFDAQQFEREENDRALDAITNALSTTAQIVFMLGMRAAKDPTWLMVGEIRDEEHTGVSAAVREILSSMGNGGN